MQADFNCTAFIVYVSNKKLSQTLETIGEVKYETASQEAMQGKILKQAPVYIEGSHRWGNNLNQVERTEVIKKLKFRRVPLAFESPYQANFGTHHTII